ncbi:hypothetical protein B0H14DRAFT_2657467 [Mycena olivaceomarginata]|nr:hypothetical protein B0H14DRAFT_2657467 [Mycena olivaceomarginata]
MLLSPEPKSCIGDENIETQPAKSPLQAGDLQNQSTYTVKFRIRVNPQTLSKDNPGCSTPSIEKDENLTKIGRSDKTPVYAPDTLQGNPAALLSEPYKLAVNDEEMSHWAERMCWYPVIDSIDLLWLPCKNTLLDNIVGGNANGGGAKTVVNEDRQLFSKLAHDQQPNLRTIPLASVLDQQLYDGTVTTLQRCVHCAAVGFIAHVRVGPFVKQKLNNVLVPIERGLPPMLTKLLALRVDVSTVIDKKAGRVFPCPS